MTEPQDHPLTCRAVVGIVPGAPLYLSRLCACGCGQTVSIVRHSLTSRQRVRGQPFLFLHGHNRRRKRSYVVCPVTGCWLWLGALDKDGYGWSCRGSKTRRAHRDIYEQHRGAIPDGLVLDHICPLGRDPRCVNPDHLEPVTAAENTRRAWALRRKALAA